jgi:AraC-like DNA-binding protein
MERRLIAPGFVQDALDCLVSKGFDANAVLEDAGLSLTGSEPVSTERYGQLWLQIAQTMDDEFFGLAARPMRSGGFSLLCHSLINTQSLEHAMRRALKFLRIALENPHGRLVVRGDLALVELADSEVRPAFAYRTFFLLLMGVLCWLVGRRIQLRWLDFACAAPADRPDYHSFFDAPVRFDQPATILAFDAAYLRLPVIRSEQALRHFLKDAPANILVRYRQEYGSAARVRARLATMPASDWPDFETLAVSLKTSPATLRRRLKADGQSYQAIKDELRLVAAQKLLLESDRTLASIAADLGYSEPSAFYRAFAKRTGQTPGVYRAGSRESAATPLD